MTIQLYLPVYIIPGQSNSAGEITAPDCITLINASVTFDTTHAVVGTVRFVDCNKDGDIWASIRTKPITLPNTAWSDYVILAWRTNGKVRLSLSYRIAIKEKRIIGPSLTAPKQ